MDISNLQRQVLHHTADVGRPKVESARDTLRSINPDVTVIAHHVQLSSENALDILGGYDVVLNCTDNFPTRYLVNDACVLLGKPLVDGSILQFDGLEMDMSIVNIGRNPAGPVCGDQPTLTHLIDYEDFCGIPH